MPEFDGDVSSLQLSFFVKQGLDKYQLQVGVLSDINDASSFVPVATINNSSTSESVLSNVSFESYSGSGKYIAFRNILPAVYRRHHSRAPSLFLPRHHGCRPPLHR